MNRPTVPRTLVSSVVLATGAALATGCDAGRASSPPAVAVAATTRPPSALSRDAIAVLIPDQVSDVAAPIPGVLLRVHVRAGDAVSAGQLVAELDPRPLEHALRLAEASRGAAEASRRQALIDVEDARRRLAIETSATAAGVSPAASLEEAKLAVKRAEAAAERAVAAVAAETAQVTTARDHLAESRVLAPFAGRVAIRYFDAGATLSAGQAVLRVVGGTRQRLRFAVAPEQAARISPGVQLTVTIDTLTTTVSAIVRQVSPALDPASGMLFAEAELEVAAGADAGLRPGLAATVRIP